MPPTPVAHTPRGGEHWYFRHPKNRCLRSPVGALPEIDIRAKGAFVVAPPSFSTIGHYSWWDGLSPADTDFSPCPDWVIEISGAPDTAEGNIENNILPCVTFSQSTGEELSSWNARDEVVVGVCNLVGIPEQAYRRIGTPFRCVLPDHKDEHPSAALYRMPKDGKVWYHDFHQQDGREWYSLPELFASHCAKKTLTLTHLELAVWQTRLLVSLGFLQPAPISMPPLLKAPSKSIQRVYDGFQLLLQCRWLYKPGAPTPFTGDFASNWTGLSRRHAMAAFRYLLSHGVIQGVETLERGGRPLRLFLPGSI